MTRLEFSKAHTNVVGRTVFSVGVTSSNGRVIHDVIVTVPTTKPNEGELGGWVQARSVGSVLRPEQEEVLRSLRIVVPNLTPRQYDVDNSQWEKFYDHLVKLGAGLPSREE